MIHHLEIMCLFRCRLDLFTAPAPSSVVCALDMVHHVALAGRVNIVGPLAPEYPDIPSVVVLR